MSVIVKGMEMPKNCWECSLSDIDDDFGRCCLYSGIACLTIGRQDNCPLVEIPTPHGRLIDATFEENHYASMLLNPTPDVTEQDKRIAKDIVFALQMAKTVIEAEGSEE